MALRFGSHHSILTVADAGEVATPGAAWETNSIRSADCEYLLQVCTWLHIYSSLRADTSFA